MTKLRSTFLLLPPALAIALFAACSHKIGDHPPPAPGTGADGFTLDSIDQFPGWDVKGDVKDGDVDGAKPDAASDGEAGEAAPEGSNETSAEADGASETDDGAIGTDAPEATADAGPIIDECGPALTTSTSDAGSCIATIASWADEGHMHTDVGADIRYCTVPPNSGPHYYIWASFRTYDRPIPKGYLVHDLEHGAVDVYYRCTTGSCPTIAAQLQAIIDARPVDPSCDPDAGVKRRVILSPDPTLDVTVAAAAWGWTYRAECVDAPSLGAFIDARYDMAIEHFCSDGIVPP